MVKIEKIINTVVDKITNVKVLRFKDIKFVSWKYLGNFNDQYSICDVGKIKLKKNSNEQKNKAKKDFFPFNSILGIVLNPLDGWWYFAPPLE